MVSKTKCTSCFFSFEVSEIFIQSRRDSTPFFFVDAVCKDCNERQTIAMHTMQHDGCRSLFDEHYKMTKEFYEDIE